MKPIEKIFRAYEAGEIFTAFDTETTGLKPSSARVVEIGAVKFNKKGIIKSYNILLNPEAPIPSAVTKIHGIKDDDVKDKPVFSEIQHDFMKFIEGTRLIAHNANFDISFINAELERCNKKILRSPQIPAIDTLKLTKDLFYTLPKHTLQFLASHFKIDSGNAHRADDDARVCMEIFLECIRTFKKNTPSAIELQGSLF